MKSIGLFGGSFNPIHNGHLGIARFLIANQIVDEVWLMVSPQNPLKHQSDLMNEQYRLSLAKLAVEKETGIFVSDFEFHLPRPSFMYLTLAALRQKYPSNEFSLVIGADNWLTFPRWVNSEEILQHHKIIIYPRTGYNLDCTTLPTGVTMLSTPLYNISSTQIRTLLSQGKDIGQLLPETVAEKLEEKQL